MNSIEKFKDIADKVASGDFTRAEKLIWEIYEKYPSNYILEKMLGITLAKQEKRQGAIKAFEKALEIKPDDSEILISLGYLYLHLEKYEDSEKHLKLAETLSDKKNLALLKNLGTLYYRTREIKRSIYYYFEALEISKNDPGLFEGLIRSLIADNQKVKASELIDNFLQETFAPNVFFLKCRFSPEKVSSDDITEARKLLDLEINIWEYGYLSFGLADYFDHIKNFDEASNYYLKANKKISKVLNFNMLEDENLHKNIMTLFSDSKLQDAIEMVNKNIPKNNKNYIFIVGMPRTGSTLIESIICSDGTACSVGEAGHIERLVFEKFHGDDNKNSGSEILKLMYDYYSTKTKKIVGDKSIIVDKYLNNYLHIGYILLSIPNAKIIYNVRDPKDNCLSIFKQFFMRSGLKYSADFRSLAINYANHEALMRFWKNKFDMQILEVSYENLSLKTNETAKKILSFLNLNLNYNENKRQQFTSETASQFQIQKPIYESSIGKWKDYQKIMDGFESDLNMQREQWENYYNEKN